VVRTVHGLPIKGSPIKGSESLTHLEDKDSDPLIADPLIGPILRTKDSDPLIKDSDPLNGPLERDSLKSRRRAQSTPLYANIMIWRRP
jgi:hypothetical protein